VNRHRIAARRLLTNRSTVLDPFMSEPTGPARHVPSRRIRRRRPSAGCAFLRRAPGRSRAASVMSPVSRSPRRE
jgi:hypothetical protein